MIKEIRNKVNGNIFNEELVYLLYKVNENSGFCFYNKKIIYIIKNFDNLAYKSLDTIFLSLKCNLKIESIECDSSFSTGYYNVIFYNDNIMEEEFETFVNLCYIYSECDKKIRFDEFFFKMSSLFQIPKEESYTNLLGFYGELLFLEKCYLDYNIDLANNWHVVNVFDKYDFCINDINCIEVKTTSKNKNVFKLKHDQIFNNLNVFIVAINIKESPNGKTIYELIQNINQYDAFSKNINFQIKLEEEKRKLNSKYANKNKFIFSDLNVYLNKEIQSIEKYPCNISNIMYDYDFDECKNTEISELVDIIKEML